MTQKEVFRIIPKDQPTKVLTVSQAGRVYLDHPKDDHDLDGEWDVIPAENGNVITSVKYGLSLDMDGGPAPGHLVARKGVTARWHFTPNGNIYQRDAQGNKHYIWGVGDKVAISEDEHVITEWIITSNYNLPPLPPAVNPLIVFGLLCVIAYVFYTNRPSQN